MTANENGDRPTPRQLDYLRSLAARAGQTFAYPGTRQQASREIQSLRQAAASSRTERAIEHKEIADAIAHGRDDAARVRGEEVTGYGATATWKERS